MLELSSLDIYEQPYTKKPYTKYLEAPSSIPLLGITKSKEGYKE